MTSATLVGRLADRDSWRADDCSMAAALDIVGRRASLLLLREAFYGAHRFDEFARRAQLSDKITATRLRELVDEGILEKRPYHESGQRAREDYHLTQKGEELLPILLGLMRWGDRWARPDGGRVGLSHIDCDAPIDVEVRCAKGHSVTAPDIQAALRG
ncbi:helix-turn-helix transcriptional regulator [Mycolicibacterium arabiense]|nr:helix-turn-helix domain-containing protein [Mycolicibacterium arabiense]MCV7375722.1 helix-turn-helix transcriptional regulator [Mycolicibacterium arabiense]